MKTLVVATISLVFLAFSCSDHVTPHSALSIKTLPFEHTALGTIFKIEVDDQGEKPVKEYGIVYTAYYRGTGNHNPDPTIHDNKITFNNAIMLGINQFTYTNDFINERTFFYYRAYAIPVDGSVVYGNRISFTI